jgi:hypothetical protein
VVVLHGSIALVAGKPVLHLPNASYPESLGQKYSAPQMPKGEPEQYCERFPGGKSHQRQRVGISLPLRPGKPSPVLAGEAKAWAGLRYPSLGGVLPPPLPAHGYSAGTVSRYVQPRTRADVRSLLQEGFRVGPAALELPQQGQLLN